MRPVPNWDRSHGRRRAGRDQLCEYTTAVQVAEHTPSALVSPLCAVLGGVVSACIGLAMGEDLTRSRRPVESSAWQASDSCGDRAALGWRILRSRTTRCDDRRCATGVAIALIGLSAPSRLPWPLLFERLTTVMSFCPNENPAAHQAIFRE